MAAAMISDRGLRKKLTQEVTAPEKPVRKPSKRKPSASSSRKSEQNNNQAKKPKTGDPKVDLFASYQPWVIQTYGDLAKTKTITLKKYQRILRTLRGEECAGPDGAKFRFWVKAKGFHLNQPPGYDAKPADGIVCRYSVADADGCARAEDGSEVYTGSQDDPALYIPTPPVKVDNSLLEGNISDLETWDYSENSPPPPTTPPPPPPQLNAKEKKPKRRKSAPYVLNTPSPRPTGVSSSVSSSFPFFSQPQFLSPSTSFLTTPTTPIGIATPLTCDYDGKTRKRSAEVAGSSEIENSSAEDEFDMFARLIANHLRKLPLSLALDTQLKIQTLVNAARIQAVYQQYSNAEPMSHQQVSTAGNLISSIMTQNRAAAVMARAMREPSLDIKVELNESDLDDETGEY